MIASSIVALSLLLNVSTASAVPTATSSMAPHVAAWTPSIHMPSIHMPSIHVPRISMPKFRLPHRTRKSNTGEPMDVAARRLTAMVGEQEVWYSDHGRYSTNGYKVAGNTTRANESFGAVQVQVLSADKKGWTAIASHPDAPGKSCVIYVGYRAAIPIIPRTRADATDAKNEAKPVCDK